MSSYRSIAAKVAATKEAHPERYCPTHRCLWMTGGGYCPRHGGPPKGSKKISEEVTDVNASPVAGDIETAGTLVFSEAVARLLRPARFVSLVPAEPEQSVTATVAAIVHGYRETETRDPDRCEVLTVLERRPAEVAS